MTTNDRPGTPTPEPFAEVVLSMGRPTAVRLVAWQLAVGPVRVGWRRVEVRGRAA
jgi:hypothetical protein